MNLCHLPIVKLIAVQLAILTLPETPEIKYLLIVMIFGLG